MPSILGAGSDVVRRYDPHVRRRRNATRFFFQRSRKLPPDIQQTARRKLSQLHDAEHLDDLSVPRGNRLEQLKGFIPPRYSIRINDQWRVTFRWSDGGADDVRIEDYHR